MSSNILISPTTSAATSAAFSPINDNTTGLKCSLLGSGETLTLQVYDESISGALPTNQLGWTNVVVSGQPYTCSDQNNLITFALDSNTYRVVKSVTAIPIGVALTPAVPKNY